MQNAVKELETNHHRLYGKRTDGWWIRWQKLIGRQCPALICMPHTIARIRVCECMCSFGRLLPMKMDSNYIMDWKRTAAVDTRHLCAFKYVALWSVRTYERTNVRTQYNPIYHSTYYTYIHYSYSSVWFFFSFSALMAIGQCTGLAHPNHWQQISSCTTQQSLNLVYILHIQETIGHLLESNK